MNKRFKFLLALCITMVFIFSISLPAFAHSTTQKGILMEGSNAVGSYIGSEIIGWGAHEFRHTNAASTSYMFDNTDTYLIGTWREYVRQGAALWAGTFTFTEMPAGAVGIVKTGDTFDLIEFPNAVAGVGNFTTNSSGHYTAWTFWLNRNYSSSFSSKVMAHEFGHVIGLADLYADNNKDKLMYGKLAGWTATAPTTQDKNGARVITGQHVTHTWGNYVYFDTVNNNNRHIRWCSNCNGASPEQYCTYIGSSKNCAQCGRAAGTLSVDPSVD